MMNGDTPKANVAPMILLSGRIYLRSILNVALREVRKCNTHQALQACERMVAKAAPFTPMPNTKMNSGSRPMFSSAPMTTEHMAMPGLPCVLMKVFSPTETSTNNVPNKYTDK